MLTDEFKTFLTNFADRLAGNGLTDDLARSYSADIYKFLRAETPTLEIPTQAAQILPLPIPPGPVTE